jgi:hypothetical protein
MASQSESGLKVSWPGIVALVVAALGLMVSQRSLESPRPTPAADAKAITSKQQGVPARLWQDPLAAASRDRQPRDKLAAVVGSERRPEPPEGDPDREKKVLFLFDCVDPENAPEAAENRRRERYAVLSALNTAGYAPTHPDRIYAAAPPTECRLEVAAVGEGRPIPYEWVEPLRDKDGRVQQCTRYQAVCVLWVYPRTDAKRQLQFLHSVSKALLNERNCPKAKFAITGRISSSQLAAMLQDAEAEFADPVRLYVTNATAPAVRRKPLSAALRNSGFTLEYVIDTDKVLADKLINELRVRDIDPTMPGSVAVIAEWETDYGREMHQVFDDALGGRGKVRHYSYLRGLDGKELGGATEKGPAAGAVPPDADGGTKSTAGKPSAKEGEGEPQIDYLRRLAHDMKAELPRLRAIGIVGSDVYDKLLLLRALRPEFPSAVFFTTDLDVRLLQPAEYRDTRNLLIASHYGLSLSESLQGKVAPFRSSYDTASYLGCLRAVGYAQLQKHKNLVDLASPAEQRKRNEDDKGGEPNGNLLVPKDQKGMPIRVYEVGRGGAYELTLRAGDQFEPPNPRIKPSLFSGATPWYLLGIALVAGTLLYPVSRPWQRFLESAAVRIGSAFRRSGAAKHASDRRDPVQAVLYASGLLVVILALLLPFLIYYAHTTEDQESFELCEGVSVWPTIVLRLLACGLCIHYIASALRALKQRNEHVRDTYSLDYPKDSNPPGVWAGLRQSCQAWTEQPPRGGNVSDLNNFFAEHGAPWQRAMRTGLLAVLNLVLFVLLWQLFDPTVVQARGGVARGCYLAVLALTLMYLAGLLMFVVDSTLLSYRFVTALAGQKPRTWPDKPRLDGANEFGLKVPASGETADAVDVEAVQSRALDQLLSIRLIDAVTNVVAARLIYYPFVVLLVLVVAQNPLFDNWHWNSPLALMALFSAGVAVVCSLLLQSAAKGARSKALGEVDDLRAAAAVREDAATRHKVARIRAEIKGTNTGAFAGFSQNPVIRAVLLPLLGGGGLAGLEALMAYLANL